MFRFVALQVAVTLLAGIVAGLIAGMPALYSALLGGVCCVVPNGWFALRLFLSARSRKATPMTFFFGELTKIAMTIALLGAIVWLYRDVHWLALIAGFVAALKSYMILLFRH